MKFKTWTHIGCDDDHYGGEYGEIDIKRKYEGMVLRAGNSMKAYVEVLITDEMLDYMNKRRGRR